MKRTCECCGKSKVAKWPKHNPHFCTMKCAAQQAVEESPYEWCEKHKEWYHNDDGCYQCEQENKDNGE